MIATTVCIHCGVPIDLRVPLPTTKRVSFICPACRNVQTVALKEMLLASDTEEGTGYA